MEDRVTKLLILAGDEGSENEGRDFGKIVQIIVDQYLVKNQEEIADTITTKLVQIIPKIPLKHHIYAGLTANISIKTPQLAQQIILKIITQLQKSLSNFQFYQALNIIAYLSELMNISLLNSLTFMNILQDILDQVQSSTNPLSKRFFVSILVRSLPISINSLIQKLFQDLKNFMELLEVHAQNDPLYIYMKKVMSKGKNLSFSLISRLGQDFSNISQFQIKRKLKIQMNQQKQTQWCPVDYFNLNKNSQDQLYKQFVDQQGRIHQSIIQQLIQTFFPRNNILQLKLQNYLNSIPSHKEAYLYQFLISILISKSLKSNRPLVQHSLILTITNNFGERMCDESSNNLTKSELSKIIQNQIFELFSKGQQLDFNNIINVANLISFIVNGWKQEWDWEKYLQNQSSFAKRRILLILIFEKIKLLNENYSCPQTLAQFPQYQPPEKYTNQMQYQTTEDMQIFENFENELKSKSNAEKISQMIKNEHDYEIFLQALFRRTSLSQTHLNILIERYKQVLIGNKQFDFALINKIRNFWKKSYTNRQMYLQMVIQKQFIEFKNYVDYINHLKDKSEKEMIWIKVELNELNNKFGGTNGGNGAKKGK